MDVKTIESIRIGDTVRVHFTHAASSGARSQPFDVVVARINYTGRVEKIDGKYHEYRQFGWRWADLPEEFQPHPSTRDDVRGLDTCSESWVVELVKRGPYRAVLKPRNYLYATEQALFLDHQKIEAYRKAKGEDTNPFKIRRNTTPVGYRYSAYNQTYGLNIPKGQYNGHLFNLVEALIARRPTISVSGPLDPDRFYTAWTKAGRPGYVGPYIRMEFESSTRYRQGKLVNSNEPNSEYKALINKKAFTKWVVRNAPRFVMTKATDLKNMIEATRQEEEDMRKEMQRDFEEGRF